MFSCLSLNELTEVPKETKELFYLLLSFVEEVAHSGELILLNADTEDE